MEAIDEYQMWSGTNRGSGPDRLQSAASPLLSVSLITVSVAKASGWGPAGTGAEISLAPETTGPPGAFRPPPGQFQCNR